MMKLLIVSGLLASCINASAQNTDVDNGTRDTPYCMTMQGSSAVLMANGIAATQKVVLKNGIQITTDGVITWPDGTSRTLKDGECVNQNGNSMPSDGRKPNTVIDNKPN